MVDLEELQRAIDYADVFAMGFRLFPERLMLDTRSNDEQGPMIRVVEPLESVQARFFWLGKERPSFGPPERFVFVPWPHSLRYLQEGGILRGIQERLVTAHPNMAERYASVFGQLRRLERRGLIEAVQGEEQYRTLWSATR